MAACLAAIAFTLAPATAPAQSPSSQAPPQPLTLAGALRFALDHYPAVAAARDMRQATAGQVAVARADYLPRLDAVWQTNRATPNNVFGQLLPQSVIPSLSGPVLPDGSSPSVWGSAAGALLTWEPFDLGLRGARVKEAEAAVERARVEEGLTRLAVVQAVGTAFFTVATAERAWTAADADVQRRDLLARTAHALADAQLRPGAEASRADAELAAARTRALQASQAIAVAKASLGQALGVTTGEIEVDSTGLAAPAAPAADPAPSSAGHPLVRIGQAAIDVAAAREATLARSNLPRLLVQSSVFARGTGANPEGPFDRGGDGLAPERVNWAAGVQIVVPNLFDFSALRARRAAATAATAAETARRDEATLAVTAQQRIAEAQFAAALAIAANTPIQLDAARQSETQARARYDAGLASLVEVADAQGLLAVADYQDAVARVDVWRAELARAVAAGDVEALLGRLGSSGGGR
ncbi:MAG: TolC family protein [Vicinamibacterales bacterium]